MKKKRGGRWSVIFLCCTLAVPTVAAMMGAYQGVPTLEQATPALATGALLAIGAIGGVMMPTVVGVLADKLGFGGGMTAILVAIALLAALSAVNAAMKPRR